MKRIFIKLFPQSLITHETNFTKAIFRITFTSFYQSSELKTDTWASLPLISFDNFGDCWEKAATRQFRVFGSDVPKPRRSSHTYKSSPKSWHCMFPQLRRFCVPVPACGTFRLRSEEPSCSLSDFSAEFGQMCLQGFEPWSPSSIRGGIHHLDSSSTTTEVRCSGPLFYSWDTVSFLWFFLHLPA